MRNGRVFASFGGMEHRATNVRLIALSNFDFD
jgi:hypothetical protein